MAKPWNDLLSRSASDEVFLTWEWLYAWTECYIGSDRRLFILTVHSGSELVGVAPWCIRTIRYAGFSVRQIEFLGGAEVSSDYLDVITKPGRERDVADSLYRFLFSGASSEWDCLELEDVPSTSLFLLHFVNRMRENGKYVAVHAGAYCPVLSLSDRQENFLAGLSPNRRQQYARHSRILQREGKVEYQTLTPSTGPNALEDFRALYQMRWTGSGRVLAFLEAFIARCRDSGVVEFDFLKVNGKTVAALLHLKHRHRLLMYLMAVDHSVNRGISIGNILVGLSIQRAIREGCSEYDFLKGEEAYKFHWADHGRRSLVVSFYRRRWVLIALLAARFVKSLAKVLVR